jgi:hypothetical protein
MKVLDKNTVESSELVEQTFNFWLNDHGHIRSPFPTYIHNELKQKATDRFYVWVNSLAPKSKDELNDEMIGEKFEEVIFDTAGKLVKTEDERITIQYPFLPRINDRIENSEKGDSIVTDRSICKTGDVRFLKLFLKSVNSKEVWNTKMELPM